MIRVVELGGRSVKLGISAPSDIEILREELVDGYEAASLERSPPCRA